MVAELATGFGECSSLDMDGTHLSVFVLVLAELAMGFGECSSVAACSGYSAMGEHHGRFEEPCPRIPARAMHAPCMHFTLLSTLSPQQTHLQPSPHHTNLPKANNPPYT